MTRFHFSNRLVKKFKKSGKKGGTAGPADIPSNTAEAGVMEEVMSNLVLKKAESDTKNSCSSTSSCSSFDVASDITQHSVERIFQEVDGHLSVTETQKYSDAVEALSESELNKKLAEELDQLQQLLEDEKKGEIHTDVKNVDPEAEIPWEQTHKRVLTMTVETHKHKHEHDEHHHHNHDPVPVNNQIPSNLATTLPNRKIPLHKEFACTNLACTDPHCSDVMCGTKVNEIKSHNSDPDLYSSKYALDTAVAHTDKTVKKVSELTSHEKDHYYGKPILFVMDSRNKFHPLTREKDAYKVVDIAKGYQPTKAQEYVVNALQESEDAHIAAHDIWTGKFIRNCQEENLMTDVNITIGDELFTAHRIMLAQFSTYFQELFCISEREGALPFNLRLRGITADAFEAFLHLVYMGDCEITPEIVMDVSMIAKRFGVKELRQKVADYLNSMSTENCLEILKQGVVCQSDTMYEVAFKTVVRCFKEAAKNVNFMELRLETVEKILSSDNLVVQNETEVFNAAYKWVKYDLHKREQFLSRVMECVRFAHMEHPELFLIFSDTDLLQKNAYCRDLLLKANWIVTTRMLHIVDPFELPCPKKREPIGLDKSPELQIMSGVTKDTKKSEGVKLEPGDLLAFGGFFSGLDKTRAIEGGRNMMLYSVASRTWTKLTELSEPRVHHAACVLDGKIYISGGSNPRLQIQNPRALSQCICFDPYTRKWSTVAPLRSARLMHCMVALNGRLYVIGGQDINDRLLNTMECYNPGTDTWVWMPTFQVPRLAAAAAVSNGKIYLAGGYTADIKTKSGSPISSVLECFDPKTNKWTRLGDIRVPRCHAVMVEVRGELFLCGGATRTHGTDFTTAASLRDIDKYNKEYDRWEKVADLDTERHACGGTAVGDKIYICGGACTALGHMLYSMEVYDTVSGKWERSAPDCPLPGKFLSLVSVPPNGN
ncbi:kelch-like protein 5 [Saccostrea cucullata]|uniref:kelch-like protein 5 n=1 Tax=Saccostrea cuccullata TaxID=36930 RepID=UPI002ED45175